MSLTLSRFNNWLRIVLSWLFEWGIYNFSRINFLLKNGSVESATRHLNFYIFTEVNWDDQIDELLLLTFWIALKQYTYRFVKMCTRAYTILKEDSFLLCLGTVRKSGFLFCFCFQIFLKRAINSL